MCILRLNCVGGGYGAYYITAVTGGIAQDVIARLTKGKINTTFEPQIPPRSPSSLVKNTRQVASSAFRSISDLSQQCDIFSQKEAAKR